jgi:hypothetical protein
MRLVFAYGSLQQDDVQRATFGRLLHGQRDTLPGFESSSVGPHTNVTFNGRADSRVGVRKAARAAAQGLQLGATDGGGRFDLGWAIDVLRPQSNRRRLSIRSAE